MYLVDEKLPSEKIILLGLKLLGYVSHWIQFFKDFHLYDLKKEKMLEIEARYRKNAFHSCIMCYFSK